ncbi:MAG: MoaD family protein [Candidatus Bathyarchaeia archaeon]
MKVKVRLFTRLREIAGEPEVTINLPENATLGEALEALVIKYGSEFKRYLFEGEGHVGPEGYADPRPYLQFLVDGKNSDTMGGLRMRLWDGCLLAIVPPVGGG